MPHIFETQPIEVERHYTGLLTQRNPLAVPIRIMGRRIIELYDAILNGNDCEITVRSTLQRRAGYVQYNTNPITGVPQKFYSFQMIPAPGSGAATNNIIPIVDSTAGVYSVFPGSAPPTQITTKTQGQQSSFFGVGNYLYIGNTEFSSKWDGGTPQGLTKWGIAIGDVPGSTSNYAGTSADAGGANPWTNPTFAQGPPDGFYATNTITAPAGRAAGTNPLFATNYSFAIPSSDVITGIGVSVTGYQTGSGTYGTPYVYFQLLQNGAPVGNTKFAALPTSPGPVLSLGGSSDLWGASWTTSSIDANSFGLSMVGVVSSAFPHPAGGGGGGGSSHTATFNIDAVKIFIYFLGGPTATVLLGAGGMTATQGYQYIFVYGNSNDGNISNPSPPSLSTGPFTSRAGVQISLQASTDPQVNQIRLFRTTDTGTGAIFFELPTSPYPNITQTVTDSAADISLVSTSAVTVGSLAFSPPPSGLQLMEWYAGRLWGAVGNVLYFSAGPDNYPLGNGNSNWPPGNVFALPTSIVKLIPLSGGNGMLVVTLDKIHIVQGITNPGFTVNVWTPDIGAREQNAVDSDGSTVYLFSSDRQFLQITSAGTNELSQYQSNITDNYDPTAVYVCQHRSGSQDSRVFLTNGSTQILPYNMMEGCWEPLQTPVDGGGVGAIGSIEIQPGIYKFLKGATSAGQLILQRDLNTFTDNATQYPWSAIFGNIPLADPRTLANVDSLVLRMTNAGNLPTISILPNDISGTFIPLADPVDEPPEASIPPTGHRAKRYDFSTGPELWQQMLHCQVQFAFPASAAQEEILTWGLFPNTSADQPVGKIPEVQGR